MKETRYKELTREPNELSEVEKLQRMQEEAIKRIKGVEDDYQEQESKVNTKHQIRKNIYQSNYLTNSYMPFTKTESNIFAIILSTLTKSEREYNWSIRDLMKHLKISERNYTFLVNALNGLYEKSINIKHPREIEKIRLLSRIRYVDDNEIKTDDIVSLTISHEIVPHLFNLKSYFTVYETASYLRLQSLTAKKLYTLFAQFKKTGSLVKSKEDIQDVLGTSYKDFSVLMAKNIRPGIREIEEVTNVNNITIEPIKKGRNILGYKFLFDWHTPQLEIPLLPPTMSIQQLDIYQKLVELYQLTNFQAKTIIEHLPEKDIHKTLFQVQQSKDQVRNIGAYTIGLFKKRNGIKFEV